MVGDIILGEFLTGEFLTGEFLTGEFLTTLLLNVDSKSLIQLLGSSLGGELTGEAKLLLEIFGNSIDGSSASTLYFGDIGDIIPGDLISFSLRSVLTICGETTLALFGDLIKTELLEINSFELSTNKEFTDGTASLGEAGWFC